MWLCFLFITLIFSNLSFMATRELVLVSASPVPISTTSTSLLLASSSSSSLSSSLSKATSFRSPHSFLRYFGNKRLNSRGGYGLEFPVKYRFYGQEKVVQWLTKKLDTVEKELQCEISKCLK